MMISIAKTAITNMANQLLLHSAGAKNPQMYSIMPTIANKLVSETLNASFNCVDVIVQRTIPLSRITTVLRHTLAE